jgi:DeoR/GlpR family transcriptional regulator of sugar metabolism
MADQLFLQERRQLILDDLKRDGRVSVKTLSEKLGVSEVTVRQDLRALEEEGYLERTYGGAVLRNASPSSAELSFDIRRRKHKAEKEAIGRAAAELVKDGYGIALDGSTTVFAMTPYLKQRDGLTIVTNSLIIAQQFLDAPHILVLLPAGRMRRDSISLVGSPDTLPDVNLNLGFFGAHGISFEAGFTELNKEEAEMKRTMTARCIQTIVVADASKWGRVVPYTYAEARDVAQIITTEGAPESVVGQFVQASVEIQTVRLNETAWNSKA